MFGGYPRFQQLVWLVWLTVFVQVLWAFAYSIPRTNELQSSKRGEQRVWYDFRCVRARADEAEEATTSRKLNEATRRSPTAQMEEDMDNNYRFKEMGIMDLFRAEMP